MNKKYDGYIRPFRFQLLQSFPYIVDDFDQYTEYELFCKLVEKVNEVIGNENEITKEVNDIKEYLETLDLQDEVNNKLDEMAEAGTLQEIISEYLNSKAIFGFDNVADLKSATNLINGSYAKTLGFYNINDGGASLYHIRTITNDDVVNEKTIISLYDDSLIAELIINPIMNIEQFGAHGDNINDDTLSFEASILSSCKNIEINKNYKITSQLEIVNKKLTGYGSLYFSNDESGNITLNNSNIYGLRLIAPCTSSNNFAHVITGSNYTLDKVYIEGNVCVFSDRTDTISNVEIINSELKGMYRDISFRGSVNNIKIENCKFSRDYTHTTPVTPDHHVYIYSNTLDSNVVNSDFISQRGSNITIKNCTFNRCAIYKRDIILINFENVTIDQIKTNNGTLVNNGTDDIITLDLCKNAKVSNVDIDWSGENGIDILTCENVIVNSCDIKKCDYAAISLDQSDVGSTFGFGDGISKNNKNILITNSYLESTRAASVFVTTAESTKITNCTLTNIYERGTSTFYGKIIQVSVNSSGGKIKSLNITNNTYIYDSNNIQVWAYPGTTEQLAVFNSWDSKMEVDEEIGRVFTLTNPTISSGANVLNVNLPLRRMKAYLLNTSDNAYYDITGLHMIKRPGQTDNNVISRGGCYLAGINHSGASINANVSFGDYISNTPINNSNPYSAPYGATTGTVKIVMY